MQNAKRYFKTSLSQKSAIDLVIEQIEIEREVEKKNRLKVLLVNAADATRKIVSRGPNDMWWPL